MIQKFLLYFYLHYLILFPSLTYRLFSVYKQTFNLLNSL